MSRVNDYEYAHLEQQEEENSRNSGMDLMFRCEICTDEYQTFQHKHFSSRWLRDILGVEESNGYYCPSCLSRHRPYPYNRIKLAIGDSSLHQAYALPGLQGPLYEGDLLHTDYLTIADASLETLITAFRKEYADCPPRLPMDVVIVAGYRDLIEGRSRQHIMTGFRTLTELILNCSIEGLSRNTVAICNLYYPPSLAWFYDNGRIPDNHPGNQLQKLELLNEEILSLNLDNNVTEFPRLHKLGIRNYVKRSVDEFDNHEHLRIKCHRFEHWVGSDPTRMISLKEDQRIRIERAINKYFVHRTDTTW